jgi:hypothetical protein
MSKEEYEDNEKSKWLIGVSGSDMDDVIIHAFIGTRDEVKEHLVSLVQIDRMENQIEWEYGTEDVGAIEVKTDGRLYAFGSYNCFHNDYTAMLEESVVCY